MKKIIFISLIIAAAIVALVYAYNVYQSTRRSKNIEQFIDKKSPGDSMTERAVNNAMSGKQPMDGEALPTEEKPKSNNLQGEGAMQGGVILEGPADLK